MRRLSVRLRRGFDALVPASCVGCSRAVTAAGPPICALCRHRFPRPPEPRCPRCGATVPSRVRRRGRCSGCAWWPTELAIVDAPFLYEGVAAAAIRALKYGRWRSIAEPMVDAMAPVGRALIGRLGEVPGGIVVPVPATAARLRERGFNQAGMLADGVGSALGLRVANALERIPGGERQAAVGAARRRGNVAGRFRAVPRAPETGSALIVDDVVTTGATLAACALALAEAGFTHIGALTFARTAPGSGIRTALPSRAEAAVTRSAASHQTGFQTRNG